MQVLYSSMSYKIRFFNSFFNSLILVLGKTKKLDLVDFKGNVDLMAS